MGQRWKMSSLPQKNFLSISTLLSPPWLQTMVHLFLSLQQHYQFYEKISQSNTLLIWISSSFQMPGFGTILEKIQNIRISRWNQLPPWLVCLYCKWLAFSPHLLASMYFANESLCCIALVELQLKEKVLSPPFIIGSFPIGGPTSPLKPLWFLPIWWKLWGAVGQTIFVTEGGFD